MLSTPEDEVSREVNAWGIFLGGRGGDFICLLLPLFSALRTTFGPYYDQRKLSKGFQEPRSSHYSFFLLLK